MKSSFGTAAYGGAGWQPRTDCHARELGSLWADCGIENEWSPLRSVVLHRPGKELMAALENPDEMQMLDVIDVNQAIEEHQQLVQLYQDQGVDVTLVNPQGVITPNLMFCADLFAMTPQGVILARPASTVRAGEERQLAACLANMGVPILRTLTGGATFEGADLIWINATQALLGQGLRTNAMARLQIEQTLGELGIELIAVDMPFGTMHLMGMLRIVDKDLAIAWPRRTPHRAVSALREAGYDVQFLPENDEFDHGKAFNFVTLGPRKILCVSGNPVAVKFYQSLGIECLETAAQELSKAAGAVGCLTGIVKRQ